MSSKVVYTEANFKEKNNNLNIEHVIVTLFKLQQIDTEKKAGDSSALLTL